MSAVMRWVIGACCAVLLTAIVSAAGAAYFMVRHPWPEVPLTTGLGGGWDTVNRDFDARIRARFPVGSSESAMAEELQREGFVRGDWSFVTLQSAEAVAMRREDRVVCRQAAYVYWRANRQGRLTSIRGVYRVEACL